MPRGKKKRQNENKSRLNWQYVGLAVLTVSAVSVAGFALARPDLQATPAETFTPQPLPTAAPTTSGPKPVVLTRSAPKAPLRVLFAGDSLTDGFFATTQEASFKELMIDKIGPVELTTAALAEQTLSTVSKVTDVPENLDLAVIELGTNDVGIPTPMPAFTKQYGALLAKVKESSPKAAIVCAGTWTATGRAYDQVIADTCAKAGGRYVSLAALYQNTGLHGPENIPTWKGASDWFHPNNSGHKAIAGELLSAIQVK